MLAGNDAAPADLHIQQVPAAHLVVEQVAGQPGQARVRDRNGQVEIQRALAGLFGRFDPEFVLAVGGGVRLGGQPW